MKYTIIIRKEAKKKLSNMQGADKRRVAEKIYRLGQNPDDQTTLDIKKLRS